MPLLSTPAPFQVPPASLEPHASRGHHTGQRRYRTIPPAQNVVSDGTALRALRAASQMHQTHGKWKDQHDFSYRQHQIPSGMWIHMKLVGHKIQVAYAWVWCLRVQTVPNYKRETPVPPPPFPDWGPSPPSHFQEVSSLLAALGG